jgi:hypothetical protein
MNQFPNLRNLRNLRFLLLLAIALYRLAGPQGISMDSPPDALAVSASASSAVAGPIACQMSATAKD